MGHCWEKSRVCNLTEIKESDMVVGKPFETNRIVLKGGDVGLNGSLHVASSDECGGKVDVTIDEVGLQTDCVPGFSMGLRLS